jgi:NADH-quinone oxidoreductase subunit J
MSAERVAFWVLGALTLAGAIATVTRRNPLVAAVWLVGTFLGMAGLFVLLQAHFLALIQVLVYAGAIMVLFVFVLMVLGRSEDDPLGFLTAPVTKLAGLGAVGVLAWLLVKALAGQPAPAGEGGDFGTVAAVGKLLLSDFLFPFEVVSLLLLAAVLGAVTLTRARR